VFCSLDTDFSYRHAAQAWQSGLFSPEVAPVTHNTKKGPLTIAEDEEFKALKLEKVPTLKPAFKRDGTVTAANASSINDGVSALVLSTLQKSHELPGKPVCGQNQPPSLFLLFIPQTASLSVISPPFPRHSTAIDYLLNFLV
jgi:Thiolase, N-terminal domain